MRRLGWVVLPVFLAVAGCGTHGPGTMTFQVTGTVTDVHGKPVDGADVFAVTGWSDPKEREPVKAKTISDSGGGFSFDSLPAPRPWQFYYLIARRGEDYLGWAQGPEGFSLPESVVNERFRVIVSKPGVFEGRVVDRAGKPVAGVKLVPSTLRFREDGRRHMFLYAEALRGIGELKPDVSDGCGVFRIHGVPAHADASCCILARGLAMARDRKTYDPRRRVVTPGGAISGRLVDAKGRGIAGVKMAANGDWPTSGYGTATSAKDGSYTIESLVPGGYTVAVYQRVDFAARSLRGVRVAVGRTTRAKDMAAGPGVFVTGMLVDKTTGEPIAGGTVGAYNQRRDTSSTDTTDSEGRFRLRAVPKSNYEMIYEGGNPSYGAMTCAPKSVTVPARGLRDVKIELVKQDYARGRAVDVNGHPVAGAVVRVGSSRAASAADGSFRIAVAPEGDSFT